MNFPAILVAALLPLVIGSVWYNPKVLGNAWMKEAGMTEDSIKGANMLAIFGLTFVFSLFIALIMNSLVIHQGHIYSALANQAGFDDPNSEVGLFLADFMEKYGSNFRTFKHGAFHGTVAGIMLALPVLGINALYERKGFRYIALNAAYWVICFALMGGVISAWE